MTHWIAHLPEVPVSLVTDYERLQARRAALLDELNQRLGAINHQIGALDDIITRHWTKDQVVAAMTASALASAAARARPMNPTP